jgi:arabinogalactan endo-1,4-beta-galactosidase
VKRIVLTLAGLLAVLALAAGARAVDVTFRVDMATQAGYGTFNPAPDTVVVRGTFNGWSGNVSFLIDTEPDLVYERAINLLPGAHEYKYVIVPAGGGDIWEASIPNRVVEVGGEDLVLDVVLFDDDDTTPIPPRDVEVLFSVDMTLAIATGLLDPANDTVVVRGNHPALGNWEGVAAALSRVGMAATYESWVLFEELSNSPVSYKFVILKDNDPDDVRWEEFIDDRIFRIEGDEPDALPSPDGNGYHEFEPGTVYFDHGEGWMPTERRIGADLSFVPRLVASGAEYRVDGEPLQPLAIFRDHGFGLVRLRLWHTPDLHWHGLDSTITFAHDVHDAGMEFMLDPHYSDTWADPGTQTKPAAWADLDFPALVDSIYAYTNAVIRRFEEEGALPEYMQIGNEVSGGFLWDEGRVGWPGSPWDTPEQWSQFTDLLAAVVAGVRDSLPPELQPKIVLHIADGGDNAHSRWFYDNVLANGIDFDVIGLSFYPWWHGTLTELRTNLHDLAERYGKELMVVESAYPWTLEGYDTTGNFVSTQDQLHPGYPATPEGQLDFLRDALATVEGVPGGLGTGFLYWEPAFVPVEGGPPNPCENLTLFDFDGDALPGLGFVVPWGTSVEGGDRHGAVPSTIHGAPNPFDTATELSYTIPPGGATIRLGIYDAGGRLVRVLVEGRESGGRRLASWDGSADDGRLVAGGVYFWRLEMGERLQTGKLTLLR